MPEWVTLYYDAFSTGCEDTILIRQTNATGRAQQVLQQLHQSRHISSGV
jgi:hypothetical protein